LSYEPAEVESFITFEQATENLITSVGNIYILPTLETLPGDYIVSINAVEVGNNAPESDTYSFTIYILEQEEEEAQQEN